MEDQDEIQQKNMISNLPLLFANGYPTSLEKITESQLQNFIPFMVQCSLGHINLQGKIDCSEPEWWPEDFQFNIPFTRPKKFQGNWMEKMKEIVFTCYQFHKSVFLLRFCNDLSSYEHASLRFINNQNWTTSLFDRRNNKLLVTFRNENMSYDQPQRGRKCLLQQKTKASCQSGYGEDQVMVEPAPFDIYLCDNCDAELYSKDAILEHEKTCNIDDDEIILCDTPEPEIDDEQIQSTQCSEENENNELRIGFLMNFSLQPRDDAKKVKNTEANKSSGSCQEAQDCGTKKSERKKRGSRRNRTIYLFTRNPSIPLTSPAGQILQRTHKTVMTPEYLTERLDRIERFCNTPLLVNSVKPKYFDKKQTVSTPHCTFKKPQDTQHSTHTYVFPRRQFSQRQRAENFLFINSPLLKRCRPISVRLKKITEQEMKKRHTTTNPKLNIKLTRDTAQSSGWKISSSPSPSSSSEIIVDTIDLCSSDDDDEKTGGGQQTLQQQRTITTTTTTTTTTTQQRPKSSKNFFQNKLKISTESSPSATSPHAECSARVRLKKVNATSTARVPENNQSEISLIPLRQPLSNCIKAENRKSLIISSSTGDILAKEKTTNNSHYDGNILLSSSPTIARPENGVTFPKPLRPSVFIFSNYTSNPLSAIVATSNQIVPSAADGANFINQNQENRLQSGTNFISKRNSSHPNALTVTDWFTDATNTQGNDSNTGHSLERARNIVQAYNSPTRVVSIDLTT